MIIFEEDDTKTNAVNSVRAAFDILESSSDFNKDLPSHIAPININIGINCGTALVGMSRFKGSIGSRMTYTASGPVTNLAARLAGLAKSGEIVVGPETARKAIRPEPIP